LVGLWLFGRRVARRSVVAIPEASA
jgi:polar amino acid transport system permease protein